MTSANNSAECPPRAEMQRLQPMAGVFRAEVTIPIEPGKELTLTGTMTSTFQLGGDFLHQDYLGDALPDWPSRFMGKGYWGFNPATGLYEGFWIDNASKMMQVETGTVDASGKIWTMVSEFVHPANGQKIKKRSVIAVADNNHHRLDAFTTDISGRESPQMSIKYSRAS